MVEVEEREFDHACSEARRTRSDNRALCGRIERPREKAHCEPVVRLHLILQSVESVHNGAASISLSAAVRAGRVRKPRRSSMVHVYGPLVQEVSGQP